MEMEVSNCGLITHPLTDDELHDCQQILLSDEFYWDTPNNRTRSNFHRYINIVEIIIPSANPAIQCIYDLRIHDSDRPMSKIFIGIAHEFMVNRLIINVRVSINRSGYATYTDK